VNKRVSILIVTKNRCEELKKTIEIVLSLIDPSQDEFLVFLDGCTDQSSQLIDRYPAVQWHSVTASIGASGARNALYKYASGKYLLGLDDDAHPIHVDFINSIERLFSDDSIGLLSFREVKRVFVSEEEKIEILNEPPISFKANEFIGCGFVVRKEVYDKTNGFPVWMDIYGEEMCLSLEIMEAGYTIKFTNEIAVHHRVDIAERKKLGRNYFRFRRQLHNGALFYCMYYKNPFPKILKLFYHNFKKYALMDVRFFLQYFRAIGSLFVKMPLIFKYRKTVSKNTIDLFNNAQSPGF
jgi:GT2 family glycosyltransferase